MVIEKPNQKLVQKEIENNFTVMNTKRMNHLSKSPDKTVRFENVASSKGSMDGKNKSNYHGQNLGPKTEIKDDPSSSVPLSSKKYNFQL